ncbi:class I SAM-dependent methyltransferase [Streptomyces coelicoflavus]|uniref:class I SAM-dependent methyltransferase n=1 Tax=Streptomyces coelicoflavus TaxID=285562 RepID=UPI003693FE74
MGDSGGNRQGTSFGSNAVGYAAHRPDYPHEAIKWTLGPVSGRQRLTVLDVGAGTGQLTSGLWASGATVIAVEPDERMRAELIRSHPDTEVHGGTAEDIPLRDGSVDAVVAGNAFHWFDQERAFPEIARVLRPGGVFAALWNDDDADVEPMSGVARILGWETATAPLERVRPHRQFAELKHAEFRHAQRCTAESLEARMGTLSPILALPDEERIALMDRIGRYLRDNPDTGKGEFDLPIVTSVTRLELRGGVAVQPPA